MVVALALAALVNADALVDRAERKPLGAGPGPVAGHLAPGAGHRQRHPDQPPARPRRLAGRQRGRGRPRRPARIRAHHHGAPRRRAAHAAGADAPTSRCASTSAATRSSGTPATPSSTSPATARCSRRPSTTRTPPASPAPTSTTGRRRFADDMDDPPARGGVHPLRGQRLPGHPRARRRGATPGPSDPRWREEYARRVAGVMDILRADDRIVFWVGLPPMRDDGFDGRADIMNEIYREAAESRPWMTYLDTRPGLRRRRRRVRRAQARRRAATWSTSARRTASTSASRAPPGWPG